MFIINRLSPGKERSVKDRKTRQLASLVRFGLSLVMFKVAGVINITTMTMEGANCAQVQSDNNVRV